MDDSYPIAYRESSRRKGALLNNRTFGRHQTFPNSMMGWRRQLGRQRGLPNGWSSHHLWVLQRTVDLVCHLLLEERLDWTRPSNRGHTLLLPFFACAVACWQMKALILPFSISTPKVIRRKSYAKNF